MPEKYEQWWAAWQRQYPGYEFKTWRDADVAKLPRLQARIAEAEGPARKADLARYEILLAEGGIYLDCDIMPYHRYDFESETAPLITCNETLDAAYCSIGFIAAEAGLPVFRQIVETLQAMPLNRLPPNRETGPWFFGKQLDGHRHKRLPPCAFYPYLYDEPFSALYSRALSQTFGIHVWGGSWLDAAMRDQKAMQFLLKGDLHETGRGVEERKDAVGAALGDLTRSMRRAREAAMEAAMHPMLVNCLPLRKTEPFELLKALDYLLEKEPHTLVWQIGAADGILVDPIRPAMVLHDPRSVLFEPNPRIFSALRRNYGGNRRAILVNAAIGRSPGTLRLNAINPEAALSARLPDWVLGISSAYDDRNAIGGLTIDEALATRIRTCVEQIEVPMLDVTGAIEAGGGVPDVVVIDVEGMDAQLLGAILDAGILPRIVQYETQCLPREEAEPLRQRLQQNYISIQLGNDLVAYRTDFFREYSRRLYVEFGLPTVFEDNLRFTLRMPGS